MESARPPPVMRTSLTKNITGFLSHVSINYFVHTNTKEKTVSFCNQKSLEGRSERIVPFEEQKNGIHDISPRR